MHFLQSAAWKEYQESLAQTTYQLSGDGWHALVVSQTSRGMSRLYAPYGPEANSASAMKEALVALDDLGKTLGHTFVRVEPTGDVSTELLRQEGYRPAPAIQPTCTWCIDLTASEETLLRQIGSTNRNHYRGYQRRGMEVSESVDVADMRHLSTILAEVSSLKDFRAHSADYLTRQAETLFAAEAARLFLVKFQGEVIAASLAYEGDGVRYYAHSGSTQRHRQLRAGNVLVASMLMDAKEKGFREFDLCGVAPDDDPAHPWAGFTKFKKSFGGFRREYSGTWEKAQKPLQFAFYQQARRLADRVR